MGEIQDLTKIILKFRNARNWKQFHNAKDMALTLSLEAAEVMEHFQWKNEQEIKEYIISHKEDIAEELSDVLYWVLLMSHDLKIDLPKAFKKKMEKNAAKYPVSKSRGNHKKYNQLS